MDNAAPPTDRKRWLAMVRMEAEARDFSWAHWNMYGDGSSHKGMGPWTSTQVQDPSSRSFQPETVEAMTVRYQAEDGLLVGGCSASLSPGFTGSGTYQKLMVMMCTQSMKFTSHQMITT